MTKLPAKVRVGAATYRVINEAPDSGEQGETIESSQLIFVRPSGPDATADTLLHECLHAIWCQARRNKDDEEEIVSALAPRILSLLRDNPKLVSFLVE